MVVANSRAPWNISLPRIFARKEQPAAISNLALGGLPDAR
jgi:hypothetical protein